MNDRFMIITHGGYDDNIKIRYTEDTALAMKLSYKCDTRVFNTTTMIEYDFGCPTTEVTKYED